MIGARQLEITPERFPYSGQWEITCRCNLRCVMCYTDCFNTPEKVRQELGTADIKRIMDQLAEAGCLELALTGGEPMARPDFFEIYEYAKKKGFLLVIFTNGTYIDEKAADRFAALPPDRIEISLHGLSKETFENVTKGKGSHEKCMRAIQLLLERKLPIVLKSAIMTLNKQELVEIKKYAQSLGPTVAYKAGEAMRRDLNLSRHPFQFELSDEEIDEIYVKDDELKRESCREFEEDNSPCRSGYLSFHIDAYGMLQLCSGNRRKGYDLRTGSFKEGFYKHLPSFPCPLQVGAGGCKG